MHIKRRKRLMVFENRVLRKVVRSKKEEVTGSSEHFIMRSVTVFGCPDVIGLVRSCEMK
jgi:hypothetical protein